MEKDLNELTSTLKLKLFTDSEDERLLSKLEAKGLPADYLEFMAAANGALGLIGEKENYADFWNVQNVIKINPVYDDDFSRACVVIGSNGSGTYYGYYPIEKVFFAADEFEMSADEITRCGSAFIDLVGYIASYNYDV
jgi:hypothetical protein